MKLLVCLQVYVPWNLHEPERNVFDFGDGGRDFSHFLNITRFVEMAREGTFVSNKMQLNIA